MLRLLDDGTVRREDGARFDPWAWSWQPADPAPGGRAVSARKALERLAAAGGLRPVLGAQRQWPFRCPDAGRCPAYAVAPAL